MDTAYPRQYSSALKGGRNEVPETSGTPLKARSCAGQEKNWIESGETSKR